MFALLRFSNLFLSSVASLWSINSEIVLSWLSAIIDLYAVLISVYLIRSFLRAAREELQKKDQFKDKPIDSYIQVVLIFIWSLAILVSFSIVSGKELIYFFTGIGALSAVLLLVFRDTILGFVASIQIAANDLVRIGDWITMESYGADGDVVEINNEGIVVQAEGGRILIKRVKSEGGKVSAVDWAATAGVTVGSKLGQ